jgi:hypothetical protein
MRGNLRPLIAPSHHIILPYAAPYLSPYSLPAFISFWSLSHYVRRKRFAVGQRVLKLSRKENPPFSTLVPSGNLRRFSNGDAKRKFYLLSTPLVWFRSPSSGCQAVWHWIAVISLEYSQSLPVVWGKIARLFHTHKLAENSRHVLILRFHSQVPRYLGRQRDTESIAIIHGCLSVYLSVFMSPEEERLNAWQDIGESVPRAEDV